MTAVLELRSVRGTGGGPEKTILFGARQHDRGRFAITVCYVRDKRDGVFGIDQRARQLNVEYAEVLERHSFDHRIWPQLLRVVRERRIDIVHGHDYKTNLLALLVARRTGVIPIATSHGWTGHSVREQWLYYPADRRLLRGMARVLAVSTDIKDRLVQAGVDPSRVVVLLNGIDPSSFTRDADRRDILRHQLGLLPSQHVVGAVGRLEPQKRFDVLLEAVAGLRDKRPEIRLVIVGDGSLRERLESLAARLGVADRCQFLGQRDDVAALHDAFDLFVQSSDYEGTPNAVLEAMAMQTPVIATDVGGTSELASPGVHALVIQPRDVTALRAAIEESLDDRVAAERRVAAARLRVERELSFAERTRKLEQVYDELMASRTRVSDPTEAANAIGARSA